MIFNNSLKIRPPLGLLGLWDFHRVKRYCRQRIPIPTRGERDMKIRQIEQCRASPYCVMPCCREINREALACHNRCGEPLRLHCHFCRKTSILPCDIRPYIWESAEKSVTLHHKNENTPSAPAEDKSTTIHRNV